jgi:hypothetical protein
MKKYFVAIFLLISFQTAHAEVTKFVFTSESQNIAPNTNSGTITVQSQNSEGAQEDVTETMDFVFTSTSATGKFLSTTGNPVSTTMSKNTSNKNFLYTDSASGNFKLSITATGRTSGKVFNATQNIIVGDLESIETPLISGSNTSSQSGSGMATPEEINDDSLVSFSVSIGKDKTSLVGTEVLFKAVPSKVKGIPKSYIGYNWSFGDGAIGLGRETSHSFKFPGDYIVVLTAYAGDYTTKERQVVHIIDPKVSVARINGGVQISNNTNSEINIEGWKLVSGTKTFTVPNETMISSNKKVIFSSDITGLNYETVELFNPEGKSFGASSLGITEDVKNKIENDLTLAKNKVADLQSKIIKSNATSPKKVVKLIQTEPSTTTESHIKNTAVVFEATKKQGTVTTLFKYPIKSWGFLKHLFVENPE